MNESKPNRKRRRKSDVNNFHKFLFEGEWVKEREWEIGRGRERERVRKEEMENETIGDSNSAKALKHISHAL